MVKKMFIVLFISLFSEVVTFGQKSDSQLVKAYISDTTGFTPYPENYLLENLKLPEKYIQLEINSSSDYMPRGDTISRIIYYKIYSYSTLEKLSIEYKKRDTAVLSKAPISKMFLACMCPSIDVWYISAKLKNGSILTVDDTTSARFFLGKVKNPFNAYLWLQVHEQWAVRYGETPVKTEKRFNYKKVKDGYLISLRSLDGSAFHTTSADFTYLLTPDFRVVFIGKRNPVVSPVDYKI